MALNLLTRGQEAIIASSLTGNNLPQLEDFTFYYLYGFSNDPNRQSGNIQAFHNLYQLVIGPIGGLCIANAFHPYFTINNKGLTVWADAYIKAATSNNNEALFGSMKNEGAVYAVNASNTFHNMNIWPDTRLTFEDNPVFSKYVPFIIPFLVQKTELSINWDNTINFGLATKGYATDYLEQVTNAIRFFMPAPAFVIGMGEFNGTNPSSVIDKFMACKPMLNM